MIVFAVALMRAGFSERHARANACASSRRGVDLQFSSDQRDALSHAEGPWPAAVRRTLSRRWNVEAKPVVADDEFPPAVGLAELDRHHMRLGMADDIRERFL